MKGYKHLSFDDRLRIESMYNRGMSMAAIALVLDRPRQTIYNELKRGMREQVEYRTLKTYRIYDAREAQKDYDYKAAAKGAPMKIGSNYALASKIEYYIVNEGRSPYDALCYVGKPFCVSTLYSYIDKGVFLNLTNKHLPEKSKRKPRQYNRVRVAKRAPAGTSIVYRPAHINNRSEHFHWEMDCVLGKKQVGEQALLVLTERVTRAQLIYPMKEKTAQNVVSVLNRLSSLPKFSEVFRSITVDNGTEFSAATTMERNEDGTPRTKLYYCHPYTSNERGSNENANRLVRRRFPKGASLSKVKVSDTRAAMRWQNSIHRRLLDGITSEQMFNAIAPVPLETFYNAV